MAQNADQAALIISCSRVTAQKPLCNDPQATQAGDNDAACVACVLAIDTAHCNIEHLKTSPPPSRPVSPHSPRKAGIRQVAATLFWGLCMIGKKGTWERDGATVTLPQVVIGAVVATVVVIGILLLLVRYAAG